MTAPELTPNRPGRITVGIVVAVCAALVIMSVMVLVPPYSMAMLPVVIAAAEYSPWLVLLDLLWCLVATRDLRGRGRLRIVVIALLLAAAAVAVMPLTKFTHVAASAAAELDGGDTPIRYSLFAPFRRAGTTQDVVERVVPYAAENGEPLVMRTYIARAKAKRPVVMVLYGGAWRSGDASQQSSASRLLAARGFAVLAADYRHAPRDRFPAQLDDVRRGLALARDSAAAWGLDLTRLAMMGRSSGGHLAELSAWAPGGPAVRAVVALYAPFDLVQGYRDLPSPDPIGVQDVLRGFTGGSPDEQPLHYHDASPSSYVRGGLPATLLVYGGRDHIVKPEFNRGAAAALRAARVPVIAIEVPWSDHGFDMAPGGMGAQLANEAIVRFLQRQLAIR